MTEPAAIRFNNPGAMWGKGNSIAKKWGATGTANLNDGLGQGNNIAYFPTKVQGACAQFDLWRTSKNYRNKTLVAAITTWSGGNYVSSYIRFLTDRVPGLTAKTVITEEFLKSKSGIDLMKAQAWHEAGKPYPMRDAEWAEAQRLVFSPKESVTKKAAPPVVAGGAAAGAAHQAGLPVGWIVVIGVAVAVAAFLIWRFKK